MFGIGFDASHDQDHGAPNQNEIGKKIFDVELPDSNDWSMWSMQ